ncbi:protein RESTRICTED TEV MOVEMENT 2-like [Abrus precatorius]|uniref:Protein RESTRICTED TEV MOVEMENT 2-like n=1 Tax=Abrus precatorius TaxID=3816 RepID=A0A8B8KJS0_ABRPR|nr:protein RESTRICTED TEV MOVEMENT 2-like [Abrus precatorius]
MSSMQDGVQPTYQDLQAEFETKETSDSHLLLVHIPDGFERMHIGAKVEYDFRKVRVFGERPLGNNRKSRFNVEYEVPNYCSIRGIKGKFDGKLVTITMPIDQEKVSKQEPQQSTETKNEKEDTSQPASSDDDHHDTSPTSPQEPVPQKGEDGISHEAPETKVESKSSPPREESEEQADHETSTPPEATQESVPEKGKVGTSQTDSKLQTEETCENEEKKQREEKGKGRNGEVGSDDAEEKGMPQPESTTTMTRIKDVAASASQVVTDLARRFNEEDKQRIIYMGAAVLVVALGVYATYKLRSSPRP